MTKKHYFAPDFSQIRYNSTDVIMESVLGEGAAQWNTDWDDYDSLNKGGKI